jgi:phage shock protein PspC (stress-responsive transcriptional regulator)/predicted membrane protein
MPPSGPARPHHHLRRDRANGILGGVCAGIAETYGLDVTLVRVLWVIAGVLWIGVPAYIVAWIALRPADGPIERSGRSRDIGMMLGLALVGIGALIAGNRVLPHGFRFDHFGGPLLLIGGGLAILLIRRRDADGDDDPPSPEPPVDSGATIESPLTGEPLTESSAAVPPSDVPPSAWTQTAPWPVPPSHRAQRRQWRIDRRDERRARRPRSFLTPLTLSILLIGGGVASLLEATGALDVNLTVVLAIATCVVGAALVLAAFAGRAHALVLVGLLLLGATAISNTIDVPLRGGIGSRDYHPLTLTELKPHYELGIGQLSLDLRDVPVSGRTTTVDAQTGIGHLVVFVPSSVRVEVHAHSGAGSVMLFGHENGGWPEDDQRAVAGSGPGVLQLDLRVGAGQVEVRRFEPGGVETILGANATAAPVPTAPPDPITPPIPTTPPKPAAPPTPTAPPMPTTARGNG